MRKLPITDPVPAFFGLFLFVLILSIVSCSATQSRKIAQSLPTTSQEQVTDWPDAARKITAGERLRFERLSVEQGLSQSDVFSILQDSQGFLWFGTEDGLNKYDGSSFTVLKHDPDTPNSLRDNWILAIFEDHLGYLWVGTLNGGLDRYDQKLDQFTHYRHDPNNPHSLNSDEVTAIYEDSDGILWLGTRNGLERFDRDTETFTHYHPTPADPQSLRANAVRCIYEMNDATLMICTEGGGLSSF